MMRGLVGVGVVVSLVSCSGTQGGSDGGVQALCSASGEQVLASRCASCHAAGAVHRQDAPAWVAFDTAGDVQRHADAIVQRAVTSKTMPPGAPLDDCEAAAVSAYVDQVKAMACAASCSGRACGGDGCGGTCGACDDGGTCDDLTGQCLDDGCTPSCDGKSCGDDGCGGTCGSCSADQMCTSGQCTSTCAPSCAGKACGPDGCGGSCGACGAGTVCNTAMGTCASSCTPSCAGKACGDDGCGGSCGSCSGGQSCNASGQCACAPQCSGKSCGPDGCGGSCGTCAAGQSCGSSGQCSAPTPTFAANVWPIFQAKNCTGSCHDASSPSEGLNLSNATTAYNQLVGVMAAQCNRLRVARNDAANSYLMNKLTGQGMCSGSRMPRNGTPLTAAQLDTVRAWINGGAN